MNAGAPTVQGFRGRLLKSGAGHLTRDTTRIGHSLHVSICLFQHPGDLGVILHFHHHFVPSHALPPTGRKKIPRDWQQINASAKTMYFEYQTCLQHTHMGALTVGMSNITSPLFYVCTLSAICTAVSAPTCIKIARVRSSGCVFFLLVRGRPPDLPAVRPGNKTRTHVRLLALKLQTTDPTRSH